jgi:hypothetical protein
LIQLAQVRLYYFLIELNLVVVVDLAKLLLALPRTVAFQLANELIVNTRALIDHLLSSTHALHHVTVSAGAASVHPVELRHSGEAFAVESVLQSVLGALEQMPGCEELLADFLFFLLERSQPATPPHGESNSGIFFFLALFPSDDFWSIVTTNANLSLLVVHVFARQK